MNQTQRCKTSESSQTHLSSQFAPTFYSVSRCALSKKSLKEFREVSRYLFSSVWSLKCVSSNSPILITFFTSDCSWFSNFKVSRNSCKKTSPIQPNFRKWTQSKSVTHTRNLCLSWSIFCRWISTHLAKKLSAKMTPFSMLIKNGSKMMNNLICTSLWPAITKSNLLCLWCRRNGRLWKRKIKKASKRKTKRQKRLCVLVTSSVRSLYCSAVEGRQLSNPVHTVGAPFYLTRTSASWSPTTASSRSTWSWTSWKATMMSLEYS